MFPEPARLWPDRKHLAALWIVSLVFATAVLAQAQGGSTDITGTGGRHSIAGRIIFPSGQRADVRLKVRLESSGYGDLTVFSDMNGSFSFQSLRAGNYRVIVDGGDFFETTTESIFIEPAGASGRRSVGTIPVARPFTVQIYLRPKAETTVKSAGVLNAALAAAPKRAADLYVQALDASAKGDTERAILQLNQALAIFPQFGLALTELGAQYLKQGKANEAARTLQTAIAVSPDSFAARLYLGIALMNQNRFADAELQLREAVKKNDSAATAHMYLGITLVNLKNYQEAEPELQKAVTLSGGKLSQAHYYLGGLYWGARDYKKAADELEKYLALDPKAANADRVRTTIKELRDKS